MANLTTEQVGTLEWWTAREVANRYGYHPGTVCRWLEEGRVKGFKSPGGTWRIHVDVVNAIGANGIPDKSTENREAPTEFRDATDYFDEPSSPKARART